MRPPYGYARMGILGCKGAHTAGLSKDGIRPSRAIDAECHTAKNARVATELHTTRVTGQVASTGQEHGAVGKGLRAFIDSLLDHRSTWMSTTAEAPDADADVDR